MGQHWGYVNKMHIKEGLCLGRTGQEDVGQTAWLAWSQECLEGGAKLCRKSWWWVPTALHPLLQLTPLVSPLSSCEFTNKDPRPGRPNKAQNQRDHAYNYSSQGPHGRLPACCSWSSLQAGSRSIITEVADTPLPRGSRFSF